jgi:hypothetical protein
MIFFGIDALPDKGNGLKCARQCVECYFYLSDHCDKVMQLAMNILEKKPYPRETVMNTAVVDRTMRCHATSDGLISRNWIRRLKH